MSDWQEIDRTSRRGGLRIGGWIVVAVIFFSLLGGGVFLVKTLIADPIGQAKQYQRIHADPNYRIAQYDHFYDTCAAIQSAETRRASALSMWRTDKTNAQYVANSAATTNIRAQVINQYNADARKADTAANFRASDLPYQISLKGNHTSCAS
jgi:hypothetical protein